MGLTRNRFSVPTRPKAQKEGMSIIILSASPGYRMKSYGPKCLLKDKHGITILQNQTEIFRLYFPQSEIILVSGFGTDKIIKNKPTIVRVVENQLYEDTNEVEESRLGLNNALNNNILITYGDMYFSESAIKTLSTNESFIVCDSNDIMLSDDVGVTVVDNYATIMSFGIEKPKWCRVAFFLNKELKLLRNFVSEESNKKLYLFEAINFILNNGGKFKVIKTQPNHEIIHVDSARELERIR